MFKGSYVAIVTPFTEGKIDEKTFRELIEFHIDNGTDGLVPAGCTGEAATLAMNEQKRLVKIAVETCQRRIPVIAGAGSNSTAEAVELSSYARKAGADGVLLITPYYNKPTPRGQYLHYAEVAKKVDIPIMLYNVPSRTGISLSPEVIAELSKIDNIVAVKEAAGSSKQVMEIAARCDINIMSGDDALALPFMSLGATGVVSVAANIVPAEVHKLVQSFLDGDIELARKTHYKLLELFNAMFIETNPLPVKTALGMMGRIKPEWRLPLCGMEMDPEAKLKEVLERYGLLS